MQIGALTDLVKTAARTAGFDLAGIAPVRDFPELAAFPDWLAAGHAGEMNYLQARNESGELKRSRLQNAVPWAQSVIVCAINYNTAEPFSTETADSDRGWISRYAWGQQDYHRSVMRRLRIIEHKLKEAVTGSDADLQTRCYVDTGPLIERVYAKYAGVGWIGKNTCIINQQVGSWLFLGVILTSLKLQPDLPAVDRCGTCTRCIDACPTDALLGPYQLDSNKCISYLTIEKRGKVSESLRSEMERHVFGCDICQDVCPWNRKAAVTALPEFQPRQALVNPPLDWLAQMDEPQFRNTFQGSPINRTKRTGMRRNAVIAMGNSGNEAFVPLLEKLAEDEDPVVAEHAHWALEKLSSETTIR